MTIKNPRPYFAELPYYLWGEVNYDSDGDCKKPTDQNWTWLYLKNRENRERIEISGEGAEFQLESENEHLVYRTACFLRARSQAGIEGEDIDSKLGDWNHGEAMKKAEQVRADFENEDLAPFDDQVFWGSWKWTGKFATDFTWVGRMIMDSVLKKDSRAVVLCASWLKDGTFNEVQSQALRHALQVLTEEEFKTDAEWVSWYFGDAEGVQGKGELLYPEPDFNAWVKEG